MTSGLIRVLLIFFRQMYERLGVVRVFQLPSFLSIMCISPIFLSPSKTLRKQFAISTLSDVTIRNKHVFDQGKEKYGTAFLNLIERVGTTSIKEKRKKVVVGRRSSLSFQRNQRVEEERLKPQQPR